MRPIYPLCSICAHDMHSPQCPHPWHLPFGQWPGDMLEKLKAMLPTEPHRGS